MKSEEWTEKLKSRFEYEMTYSNMSNETALNIISAVVSEVLGDMDDEKQYSPVETMIERALDKFDNIRDARSR